MSLIQYGYFSYPGDPTARPMAAAIAINLLTGKSKKFLGILDTGADSVTLTSDLLIGLGVDPDTLKETDVGGVNGIGLGKKCKHIKIGLIDPISTRNYFPNNDLPVPVVFSAGSPFCLLGRNSFLNLCTATFDGMAKLVTLDF